MVAGIGPGTLSIIPVAKAASPERPLVLKLHEGQGMLNGWGTYTTDDASCRANTIVPAHREWDGGNIWKYRSISCFFPAWRRK